jgi:hypothetical protein
VDSASDSYDSDSDNDEEDDPSLNAFDLVQGQAPLYDDPDAPTVDEVLLWMFDYMSVHRATRGQCLDTYKLLRMFLPVDTNEDMRYEVAKTVIDAHLANTLVRIAMCPNDCIVYCDAVNRKLAHRCRNAHRTACPHCGEARDYTDQWGNVKWRKVAVYVFFTLLHLILYLPPSST